MKYIIVVLLLNSFVFGIEKNIQELQNQFKKNVIEASVYKKYYKKYILSACDKNDLACQINLIDKIKLNDSVKKNKNIQKNIDYLYSLTYTSPYYLKTIEEKLKQDLDVKKLNNMEFVSAVDLKKQLYTVFLYDKQRDKFYKIGTDLISSGDKNKEGSIHWGDDHYFDTPTGLFKIKTGWRSKGQYKTYKNERYQPYGSKNRFIYYIGKVPSERYNVFDRNKQKIKEKENWNFVQDSLNFAMHSHISNAPLGQKYSHGCIRMRDEFNYFLDTNSVLHKPFFKEKKWKLRFTKKPKELKYQEFAGEYIVIFNSI